MPHQVLRNCQTFIRFHVDADAALVAIEIAEEPGGETVQPSCAIPVWRRFDPDHIGAQIGKHNAAGRSHHGMAELKVTSESGSMATVRPVPPRVAPACGQGKLPAPHLAYHPDEFVPDPATARACTSSVPRWCRASRSPGSRPPAPCSRAAPAPFRETRHRPP